MPAGPRRPRARTYTVKVHRVHERTRTLRCTIPETVAMILDISHGDKVTFEIDPVTRRVTFRRE